MIAIELPVLKFLADRNEDPELYEIIVNNNLHGPCSESSCLDEDGACKKGFPFSFREQTEYDGSQRVQWRRQNVTSGELDHHVSDLVKYDISFLLEETILTRKHILFE